MFSFGATRRKKKGNSIKLNIRKGGPMSQGALIGDFSADAADPFGKVNAEDYNDFISKIQDKTALRDWEDKLMLSRKKKDSALRPLAPNDGLPIIKQDPDSGEWLRDPLTGLVPKPFKTIAGETCWNPVNEDDPNNIAGGWINGCRPGFVQSGMKYSTRKCCHPDPNYDYKNAAQYSAMAAFPKCSKGKTICKTSGKCVSIKEAQKYCGGVIKIQSPKAEWLSNQLKLLVRRYFMGNHLYGVDLGSGKVLLPKWLTNFSGVSGSTAAEKLGRVRLLLFLCEQKQIPLLKRDKAGLGFKREFEKFSELAKYCGASDQFGHIYTLYLNGNKSQFRVSGASYADQYGPGGAGGLDTALVRAFSDALHGAHSASSSASEQIKALVGSHFAELHSGMYGGGEIKTVLGAADNVANAAAAKEALFRSAALRPKQDFGRRRRRSRKVRKVRRTRKGRKGRKSRKGSKKPSSSVLRMCKRLKIKATKKVGKRRVYKKVSVLKKLIKRKLKMMKKRIAKHRKAVLKKRAKRSVRKVRRTRKVRRSRR
jgi:hypothetical protein